MAAISATSTFRALRLQNVTHKCRINLTQLVNRSKSKGNMCCRSLKYRICLLNIMVGITSWNTINQYLPTNEHKENHSTHTRLYNHYENDKHASWLMTNHITSFKFACCLPVIYNCECISSRAESNLCSYVAPFSPWDTPILKMDNIKRSINMKGK